jgi:hypothetical protein
VVGLKLIEVVMSETVENSDVQNYRVEAVAETHISDWKSIASPGKSPIKNGRRTDTTSKVRARTRTVLQQPENVDIGKKTKGTCEHSQECPEWHQRMTPGQAWEFESCRYAESHHHSRLDWATDDWNPRTGMG